MPYKSTKVQKARWQAERMATTREITNKRLRRRIKSAPKRDENLPQPGINWQRIIKDKYEIKAFNQQQNKIK